MLNLFCRFCLLKWIIMCFFAWKNKTNESMNKLRVIVTGATGMVGEGVLHECLNHSEVEKVLVVTRQPTGYKHPKFSEIVHKDFFDISSLKDQLTGYNACYFCLGVTSVGKKESEYTKLTYDLTLNFASTLAELNPDMTFCYISGVITSYSIHYTKLYENNFILHLFIPLCIFCLCTNRLCLCCHINIWSNYIHY